MIAHNPLHGSGRAVFPHPALALGDDAHASQGIARRRAPRAAIISIREGIARALKPRRIWLHAKRATTAITIRIRVAHIVFVFIFSSSVVFLVFPRRAC